MCARLYCAGPAAVVCSSWRKLSISLSPTWILLSTSRSRSREIRISLRMSSRNFWNDTPCRSSAARKSASDSLFCSAIVCTVRSICRSSARTPVSRAYWTCTRSVIMRSSTCRSSTSARRERRALALELALDHPYALGEIALGDDLLVDDGNDAIDELRARAARGRHRRSARLDAPGGRGWMPGEAPPGSPEPGARNCAAAVPAATARRIRTTSRISIVTAISARRAGPDRRDARRRARRHRRPAELAGDERRSVVDWLMSE